MRRASFDPLFQDIALPFESDSQLLQWVQDFTGPYALQNKTIHEFTHYFSNGSPVSRAIRALRTRGLVDLLCGADAGPERSFRAYWDWQHSDAITQYLLPVYEGMALMAEFDLSLFPLAEKADHLSHHHIMGPQLVAAVNSSAVREIGFHRDLGYPDERESYCLDAHVARLFSPAIRLRKTELLNQPLVYQRADECYLVAWLFAREVHRLISCAIESNPNPAFVIKYLRSYFLDDWGLVAKILDLFEGTTSDTRDVVAHIQRRLKRLSDDFTNREYDAYREAVVQMLETDAPHHLLLPGLLREESQREIEETGARLEQASLAYLNVDSAGAGPSKKVALAVSATLGQLGDGGFVFVHSGEFDARGSDGRLVLAVGEKALDLATTTARGIPSQRCRADVFLCAAEPLQRVVRLRTTDGVVTGWTGGVEPGALTVLGDVLPFFEASVRARTLLNTSVERLYWAYGDDLSKGYRDGSQTGCAIFARWLLNEGGFYARLNGLSEALGLDKPPRSTFRALLRGFLDEDGFNRVIQQSLAFGVGYNAGGVSFGEAKWQTLRGSNFSDAVEALYRIREDTGYGEMQFFYVDKDDDAERNQPQLVRYYF